MSGQSEHYHVVLRRTETLPLRVPTLEEARALMATHTGESMRRAGWRAVEVAKFTKNAETGLVEEVDSLEVDAECEACGLLILQDEDRVTCEDGVYLCLPCGKDVA